MTLDEALSSIQTSLQAELAGWEVNASLIGYPKDKLVDVLYTNFDYRYLDMGTRAYVGSLAFYLYRLSGTSYAELLQTTDKVLDWCDSFSDAKIHIGNNSEILAQVSQVDGTFDNEKTYRVIEIVVPVEIIS